MLVLPNGTVTCIEAGHSRREGHAPDTNGAAMRQRKQDRALALWRGSAPVAGTPAEVYLTARGLLGLGASPALRFRPGTPHPEALG